MAFEEGTRKSLRIQPVLTNMTFSIIPLESLQYEIFVGDDINVPDNAIINTRIQFDYTFRTKLGFYYKYIQHRMVPFLIGSFFKQIMSNIQEGQCTKFGDDYKVCKFTLKKDYIVSEWTKIANKVINSAITVVDSYSKVLVLNWAHKLPLKTIRIIQQWMKPGANVVDDRKNPHQCIFELHDFNDKPAEQLVYWPNGIDYINYGICVDCESYVSFNYFRYTQKLLLYRCPQCFVFKCNECMPNPYILAKKQKINPGKKQGKDENKKEQNKNDEDPNRNRNHNHNHNHNHKNRNYNDPPPTKRIKLDDDIIAEYEIKIAEKDSIIEQLQSKHKTTKQGLIWQLYDQMYQNEAWWINNQCIPNDCGVRRRPDRMNEFDTHIVIWEIDEHQHKKRSKMDEKNRKDDLSLACKNKPIIMIRFNPDSYKDKEEHGVPSCFNTDQYGLLQMDKSIMKSRLEILHHQIRRCWRYNNIRDFFDVFKGNDAKVHQIYLFYDHYDCVCLD